MKYHGITVYSAFSLKISFWLWHLSFQRRLTYGNFVIAYNNCWKWNSLKFYPCTLCSILIDNSKYLLSHNVPLKSLENGIENKGNVYYN